VNLYALQVMQSYHTAFSRDQRAQLELAQASSKERLRVSSMLQSLLRDLQSMELMVYSFNAEKNIQLLVLCADMVKRMAGGRIICCKSAKDRTSMSVTWDQARILYEQHGLGEHDVQSALNLMRTEGVRKLNVIKNTGQSAYAFNVIQRSFLPPIFRPPEHACSSSIDG
jgi:inositol polyphosphate-4-phosphatase